MYKFRVSSRMFFVVLAMMVALVGCKAQETPQAAATDTAAHAKEEHAEVHWGYEGEAGPENWGTLSPDWELCKSGTSQSPIDLTAAVLVEGGLAPERRLGEEAADADQKVGSMDLLDNGHTIQVTPDVPVTLDIGETRYELVQFHFHAPSEHTIDGEHSPLEAHFVHKSESGGLAVVGVLFDEGEPDELMQTVIDALPSGGENPRHLDGLQFDLAALRPLPKRYYRYTGSLTTPPCSEGVEWIVSAEKGHLSHEQIEALDSRMPENARPVQPLNDRELSLVTREAK